MSVSYTHLRNGTYPISVSSERIFQGLAIARYANEIGADAIAHGSTGAGKDVYKRQPNNGNTSQANTPCSSQKLSQLHSFTFFIGTYELDWQKLPMAMMINPIR